MSFAKKHNTVVTHFDFETPSDFDYKKPANLIVEYGEDKVYPVKAIYINKKGQFGDEPVIVTDEFIVNAPSHLVDSIKEIFEDENSVKLINEGKVGFKLYSYENKFGTQYSVTWVDVK